MPQARLSPCVSGAYYAVPLEHGWDLVADRLIEEATFLLSCAGWLEQLAAGGFPPVVNLRPDDDWENDNVVVDHGRVVRILRRIAGGIDELARARRVADLSSAEVDADPRLGRRRRFAEPPIEFSTRDPAKWPMSLPQACRAWAEYQRRLTRAGLPVPPNSYRHLGSRFNR